MAYLVTTYEVSQRRACEVVRAPRSMVRYRHRRPDDAALRARLESLYPRVTAIECGSTRPRRIAFCSGSGNSAIPLLAAAGADTLVTGELREEHFNFAQENGLNLFLCGHYATEVHAVKALAAELARKFRLPWEFIATGNPL